MIIKQLKLPNNQMQWYVSKSDNAVQSTCECCCCIPQQNIPKLLADIAELELDIYSIFKAILPADEDYESDSDLIAIQASSGLPTNPAIYTTRDLPGNDTWSSVLPIVLNHLSKEGFDFKRYEEESH